MIPSPQTVIENQKKLNAKDQEEDIKASKLQLKDVSACLMSSKKFPVKYNNKLNYISLSELNKAGWSVRRIHEWDNQWDINPLQQIRNL